METDKLYIQMFSLHGLIRSDKLEMGRDADTGGQIKYVLEEGLELSKNPEVGRVDLFTRRINDKTVSDDYNRPRAVARNTSVKNFYGSTWTNISINRFNLSSARAGCLTWCMGTMRMRAM